MKLDLPRYVETRPGETPDAYFLDGARAVPISRVAASASEPAPFARISPPIEARTVISEAPPELAQLCATVASVARAHATIARAHATTPRLAFPPGLAALDARAQALAEAEARIHPLAMITIFASEEEARLNSAW
jgi:hypothetical protein